MKKLGALLRDNSIHLIILCSMLIILLWKIDSYPNQFDSCVEYAIHPQVNKVLDNEDYSKEVTWVWTDMYQHAAGRSPLYSAVIELGLRLFGLTLFGVRIFSALLAFIVLVLVYQTMRKYYSDLFVAIFVILLASSPWYLIMSRSGGIIGFSLTLVLLSLCLIAMMFNYGSIQFREGPSTDEIKGNTIKKHKKVYILSALSAISIALLPYGHALIRHISILLVIWVILFYGKIGKTNLKIFIASILIMISIQLQDIGSALKSFFNARGEGLLDVAKGVRDTEPNFIINKLITNIQVQLRFLFGLNDTNEFWNPNLVYSYWKHDIVLYPRFLVPFFIIGFILYLINIYNKRSLFICAPVILFFATLIPGLMAGFGYPNAARNYIMVVPLYFFIAYAFYSIFIFVYRKIDKQVLTLKYYNILRVCFMSISIIIIGFTTIYQVNNFYNREKGAFDEKYTPAHSVNSFLGDYFEDHSSGRVLIHETPVFGKYSYVAIRWLGGIELANRLESGQVMFLKYDNSANIENLLKSGYFDIILSSSEEQELEILLPDLNSIEPLRNDELNIYYLE